MTNNGTVKILVAGLLGGLIGNGMLGALFSAPPIHSMLYNPEWQSPLFIDITPKRNIPVSVAGLVALNVIHAWLFSVFMPSIPGKTWLKKRAVLGANDLADVLVVPGMVYLQYAARGTTPSECAGTRYSATRLSG